jgi:hypothetical protein
MLKNKKFRRSGLSLVYMPIRIMRSKSQINKIKSLPEIDSLKQEEKFEGF